MVQEDGGSNPLGHPISPRRGRPGSKTDRTRRTEPPLTLPAAPVADAEPGEVVEALPADGPPPPEMPEPPEITEVSPFERRLTLRMDRLSLEKAKNDAARRLSRGMNIKGFRRGKAPRRMVESAVGSERVRDEAMEIALPGLLGPALRAAGLVPAVTPVADNVRETDEGAEVDILVSLWPVLDRPPVYEGRQFEVTGFEVTEEMVEANIERILGQFAELETVGRPAEEGDYVSVNLHASRNGRPVEAASADDLLYEVGSGTFLEGLDANLAGCAAGEVKQFITVLPAAMTGGRQEGPVEVSALVKEVRRKILPDIDDEWVSDHTEYETEAELRQGVTEQLGELRLEEMRKHLRDAALAGLVEEAQVEIPPAVIHAQAREMLENLGRSLQESGRTFDDFLQSTGSTPEQFQESLLDGARVSLSEMIILEAVARRAGITVGDEELRSVYESSAARLRESPQALAERLRGTVQERSILSNMLRSKAGLELARRAVAVDGDGNPLDLGFDPPADVATDAVAEHADPQPVPDDDPDD